MRRIKLTRHLAIAGLLYSAASIAIATPHQAKAQAFTPVVDVCTGVSLPHSALTDFLGDVNTPIVTSLQGTINDLLGLPIILLPPLSIDVAGIIAGAAAGDPISIDVLDSDGNIVSPGNCNITADGITLNDPAGISIGGNAITGLGANGLTASAADIDAIALGNNASTGVGATASIAIGLDASATAADSVALGAGSLADRGPVAGYAAPGIVGLSDSVGSVSVGSAGGLRQITNVAPGTAATDAATVGQVQGLVGALMGDAVQYDDPSHAVVTFDGASGTTLTNVAPGTLASDSTDAVNGSQLFATNEALADLETLAVQYTDATQTAVALGGAGGTTISNLAAGELSSTSTEAVNGAQLFATNQQVDTNTTAITNLDARVTINENAITNLTTTITELDELAVQYTDAGQTDVVLGGAGGTTISNVAGGELSSTSTEAVNGAQLFATNTAITNLEVLAANVPVTYVDDADGTTPSPTATSTVRLIGTGDPVTLNNLAEGQLIAGSTEAVNGSQLFATNQQVAANTTTINQHTTQITDLTTGLANVPVQYSNPAAPTTPNGGVPTNDVTLVGSNAGPVALHNVADGALDNDAVNLGQMNAGLSNTLNLANDYTDARFAALNFDLGEVREESFAGTAGALAAAGLPQVMDSSGMMVAGAVGHYRGETAFAIGLSTAFNDGRAALKVAGTMDTRGHGGFTAGVGFGF